MREKEEGEERREGETERREEERRGEKVKGCKGQGGGDSAE